MIKVKGGESQTSQHAASAMSKAFGGMVKKAVSGGEQPKGPAYEQVAIRAGKSFVESSESSSYSSSEKAPQPVDSGELKATKEEDSDFEFSDGEDDTLARIHQARLEQLKKQNSHIVKYKALGHGSYSHITEEQFLPSVTTSKHVVCHFFHQDFERCKIVDKHLAILATKYLPTKFIFLDAAKAPFFVEKLKIQTLPTIVLFRDGIAVDRIVGFEELGGVDDFPTKALEDRLKQAKILRSVRSDGEEIEGDEDDDAKRSRANFRSSNRGFVGETGEDD